MNRVAAISEAIGRLTVLADQSKALRLRRINRARTIHGSLAIEGNTLSEAQITAILDGKRVIAPPREVQEVKNALAAYDVFHYEFEFIHPFADGNGRMGRLWQNLILAQWNPLFADIPVESLIFEHQAECYQAIQESTRQTDSAPFIAFMLRMILDTMTTSTPEATLEVTPEVRLISVLTGEMTRQQLKEGLGLKDDEHFRKAYLLRALDVGLIEMTIPNKPRSSKQKYRLTDKGRKRLAQRDGG